MGTILKFPPRILHVGGRPPDSEMSVILSQALSNLRVPRAASRLMIYYAAQSTGFRPSLSRITEKTGINQYNISRTRAQLVKRGLIAYTGDDVIIDWVRLSAFAACSKQLMGTPGYWLITPLSSASHEENDLHNNKGTRLYGADLQLAQIYEATAEALRDGVKFPELASAQENDLHNNMGVRVSDEENDLHNIYGNEILGGWYNPFNEPDPEWVNQPAIVDAYGEIVAYAHYNTQLPF